MKLELKQPALAKELGVTSAAIARWENESRTPQLATLGKFYSFCERKASALTRKMKIEKNKISKPLDFCNRLFLVRSVDALFCV